MTPKEFRTFTLNQKGSIKKTYHIIHHVSSKSAHNIELFRFNNKKDAEKLWNALIDLLTQVPDAIIYAAGVTRQDFEELSLSHKAPAQSTIMPDFIEHFTSDSLSVQPQAKITIDVEQAAISAAPKILGEIVTVFFGTTKTPTIRTDAFQYHFYTTGEEQTLRQGVCEVVVPAKHKFGQTEDPWAKYIPFYRDKSRLYISYFSEWNEKGFQSRLAAAFKDTAVDQSKDVLLFVHGYTVGFDSCVKRIAQLSFDIQWPGVSACFVWPSFESRVYYTVDAERVLAEGAKQHFLTFVNNLAQSVPEGGKIHVISHSIGNRLTTKALYKLRLVGKLGKVIFAAPDVRVVDFTARLGKVLNAGAMKNQCTVYSCRADKALQISSTVQDERIGEAPVSIDFVDVIEVTNANHDEYFKVSLKTYHGLVYEMLPVANDLRALLRGLSYTDRGLTLIENTKLIVLDCKTHKLGK